MLDLSQNQGTTNFAFLGEHDALLVELATAGERSFSSDPNTTLIKLRQLGEALAQHMATTLGVEFEAETSQADLLYKLNREMRLDPTMRELFHTLRIEGNRATHEFRTQHKEAMAGLTIAWPDAEDGHFKVPFVYSCNGRPFVKQLAEQSGTWFRDVRHPSNTRYALPTFHTPGWLIG